MARRGFRTEDVYVVTTLKDADEMRVVISTAIASHRVGKRPGRTLCSFKSPMQGFSRLFEITVTG